MAKKKELMIDNFTMFGAKYVHIELYKYTIDGEISYNPHLTIFLDDGKDTEGDFDREKVVTIITDNFFKDPKFAAFMTARSLSIMFDNIMSVVNVFDDEQDIIDSYDLNEVEPLEPEEDISDIDILGGISDSISVTKTKRVLH